MPAAKRKKPAAKPMTCPPPLEVVVTNCKPNPDPAELSKTCKNGLPDSIFFSTKDPDRVYLVEIKSGVFGPGKIKQSFWSTHPTPVYQLLKDAKKERFEYKLKVIEGVKCTTRKKDRVPPTIIIQD